MRSLSKFKDLLIGVNVGDMLGYAFHIRRNWINALNCIESYYNYKYKQKIQPIPLNMTI